MRSPGQQGGSSKHLHMRLEDLDADMGTGNESRMRIKVTSSRNWNPRALLVGAENGTATLGNRLVALATVKPGVAL